MTEQELINMLLEQQEHPEQQSEASLKQALKDKAIRELLEQMVFTKRALAWREAQAKEPSVEEDWQSFQEVINDKREVISIAPKRTYRPSLITHHYYKIAASFIGVLLVSGIAFAAVHIMQSLQEVKSDKQEVTSAVPKQLITHRSSLITSQTDTIPTQQPVVFENVAIDKILNEVAAYYSEKEKPITVEFGNDELRQLRFYFVWRQEAGLDKFIEQINHFESISITRQGHQIIVE